MRRECTTLFERAEEIVPGPSPYAFIQGVPRRGFFRKKRDVRCTLCTLRKRREDLAVQSFLDGLVRSTKTVMTRVELGGTLFLVAVIGVLLTSRKEGGKSD
jgi:hypothetical protein